MSLITGPTRARKTFGRGGRSGTESFGWPFRRGASTSLSTGRETRAEQNGIGINAHERKPQLFNSPAWVSPYQGGAWTAAWDWEAVYGFGADVKAPRKLGWRRS
jgi:hypothetical protein